MKVRESRPELFRLVLMFGIVFYHVLLHAVPGSGTLPLLAFARTLLHVGVPCFVLLSGWYGIHPSIAGLLRLWTTCFFYSVVLFGVSAAVGAAAISPRSLATAFMPVLFSREWWFVDIYLALYISAPILETFLRNSDGKTIWLSIAGLFFLSFYVGHGPHNGSFAVGKNLCHFMMLYMIGNRMRNLPRETGTRLQSGTPIAVLCLVFALASPLVAFGRIPRRIFEECFFAYNSPGLVLLSVVFFLWFLKPFLDDRDSSTVWRNTAVNSLARSAFAIYLLSENNFVLLHVHSRLWNGIFSELKPMPSLLVAFAVSVLLFSICLAIDRTLRSVHAFMAERLCDVCSRLFQLFEGLYQKFRQD